MSESARKPLLLVDGSSYLYRAYYALPPLTSPTGAPTGALYGVINMLHRLLADYEPEHIAVVFDAPGRTFRDDLFDQYKAHRPKMPDDLAAQIEPLHELVRAMGLPLLRETGVEADDVIGTLASRARDTGWDTVISTGDKDMAQLVDGRVTLINTMTGTKLDHDGVVEKFGVPPGCIVDYLALVGDSSDNIPGVPKVGPKTAAKWLQAYGSLEAINAHADELKGKVGESLREHQEQLALSRQLATIRCDVTLDWDLDDLRRQPPDTAELRRLYRDWGFVRLLERLPAGEAAPEAAAEGEAPAAVEADYETVLDEAAFERWLQRLEAAPAFAFDTETDSLDYMRARLVGVSFAVRAGEAAYVPVAHDYEGAPGQLSCDWVLERLRPLLEDPERPKIGHNLKYDMSVLARHGVTLRGIRYDTMLASYVYNSVASRHDMDDLAARYLGLRTIRFEEVAGKGAKQVTFDQVPLEQAAPYAAEDADITLRLHEYLWPQLEAEPRLKAVYEELEVPLVPVLSRIERTGIRVDTDLLVTQSGELAERIAAVCEEAHAVAGEAFNLDSPKQIQAILFEKQGLPVLQKTPKGQPSTSEAVLSDLADRYPLPRLILECRSLSKLKSTYTSRLPEQVNPDTGRLHTSFHQAVTATGRLSSSNPNLQNIPVRTTEGRRIRQAFVAAPGHRLVAADYSQIELRIMAHLSGDPDLVRAFAEGRDIHRATAAEIFGLPLEAVDGEQRRRAKAINFGLIYGMSAFGLARQLGVDRSSAQTYMDRYFQRYPAVREYMDSTRERARERGYVETLSGRRLYLPEIRSRNYQRRQYAERTAINAPMQGSAADIIKRAMIAMDAWIAAEAPEVRMVLQVHDELVFEVPEDRVEAVIAPIRERMVQAGDLTVPLVVDVGVGDNWEEAH